MPSPPPITLRPAQEADADQVFGWANDPVTRAVSFQTGSILYEDHIRWFSASLTRPDRHLFIACQDEQDLGLVRLDDDEPGTAVIGINIAPAARGRRLGTAALLAATHQARDLGYLAIIALIRPTNQASVRAFTRAGYVPDGSTTVHEQAALRFVCHLGQGDD